MSAANPPAGHDGTVRGEVVPRGEPTRARAGSGPRMRRRGRVGGLVRLAWRLGGRARRPAAATVAAAVPAARVVADPLVRAVAPRVAPVLEPVLRPVAPLAGALTSPLGRIVGDQRKPRPAVALRLGGQDAPVDADRLAAAYPASSGRLVVLVPASGEDERVWHRGEERTGGTYGDRLAALLGWSPVTLRYDAGAPAADAALALGALLQQLVDAWPVPVSRLVLVAHGDGGLLARGALGVRPPGPRPWTDLVTELVALGTPSLGTDREPASGTMGRALDQELAGIVVAGPEVLDVEPLDHVDYLLVADRLTSRPNPVGRVLGGLLRPWQRSRRVYDLFPTAERFELPADRHPLVNHPDVHEALLRWLG